MKKVLVGLIGFAWFLSNAAAENWPSWRGPTGNGICTEKGIPTSWKAGDETWRAEIPGWGSSTPAIWGDHIFLTTAVNSDLFALCFNTEGKLLWKKPMGSGSRVVRGGEGNSACISPVTDGKRVWFKMSTGLLVCFDFDGKEIWRTDLQERFGKYRVGFIVTSTPVLYDNKLFLHLLHDGESYVAALNADNGEKVWYSKRETGARAECKHGYTSPFLYNHGGDQFLVSHGSDFTIAYELSNGKERWRCGGFQPQPYHRTLRFIASPATGPNLIVSPSAKNEAWLAIDPNGAKNDITRGKQVKWTMPSDTPDVSCPLIHDGLVYISREKAGGPAPGRPVFRGGIRQEPCKTNQPNEHFFIVISG